MIISINFMTIITLRSAMEIGKATVLGNFRLRWPASGKGMDDSNLIFVLNN